MHRKSAYILFSLCWDFSLSGLSCSLARARLRATSHGDVYFSSNGRRFGSGLALRSASFAALIDYHFWQRTWWLWFALALVALSLCYFPAHRDAPEWIAPLDRPRPANFFSPRNWRSLRQSVFLAAWFARREEAGSNVLYGLILPLAIISIPADLFWEKSIWERRLCWEQPRLSSCLLQERIHYGSE